MKFGFDWPSGFRGDCLNIVDDNDGHQTMGIL